MDEDNERGKEGGKLNSKKEVTWFGLKCVRIYVLCIKKFFFCVYEYKIRIVCKYVSKAFFVCFCVCMCMYEPFLLKRVFKFLFFPYSYSVKKQRQSFFDLNADLTFFHLPSKKVASLFFF